QDRAELADDDGLDAEHAARRLLDLRHLDGAVLALRVLVLEALDGVAAPEGLAGDAARALRQGEGLRRRGAAAGGDDEAAAADGRVADDGVRAPRLLRLPDDLPLGRGAGVLHQERVAQDRLVGRVGQTCTEHEQRSEHDFTIHLEEPSIERLVFERLSLIAYMAVTVDGSGCQG